MTRDDACTNTTNHPLPLLASGRAFQKTDQVRFDNSFVEYSSVNRADIPNQQLSLTGLKPYRLMSINRGLFGSPRVHATTLIQIQRRMEIIAKNHRRPRALV